jgi:hypothetical protein
LQRASHHAAFDDQVVAGGCGVRNLKVERFIFRQSFAEQCPNLIGSFEVELETGIYKCCVSRVELRQANGILCFVSGVEVTDKCGRVSSACPARHCKGDDENK